MPMKKFYVGVKGIIQEDRGILLLKHAKGHWDIPGGRMNEGEDFADALAREISEELPGSKLASVHDLQGAFRLPKDIDDNVSLVLLYFLVSVQLPERIALSEEHVEFLWVKTKAEIPENVNPKMKTILGTILSQ
jgi:ADP-ribose pyrophosphatase YjhB (NUDIX family)